MESEKKEQNLLTLIKFNTCIDCDLSNMQIQKAYYSYETSKALPRFISNWLFKISHNFKGANLTGANLGRSGLCGINLSSAKLNNASINHTDMSLSNFKGAKFINATLVESYMYLSDFAGADFTKANLTGVKNFDSSYPF